MKSIITLLIFALSFTTPLLHAAEKVGVLLMHGKGGTSLPRSPIGKLASALEMKGFFVTVHGV